MNTTASLGCWVRRRWAGSWNRLFLSHGRISPQGFFHLLSPRRSLVFCPHGGYSCTDHSFSLGRKWGEHTIISTLNKCWVLGPQGSHITQCLWPSVPSLIHKPLTLLHCQSTDYNLEQAGTESLPSRVKFNVETPKADPGASPPTDLRSGGRECSSTA